MLLRHLTSNLSVNLLPLVYGVSVVISLKLDLILNRFILVANSSVVLLISVALILTGLVLLAKIVNKGGFCLYDTYTRLLYDFFRTNFPDLIARFDSLIDLLAGLQLTADHLLQSVLFFGFLFFSFKFVRQRWFTLC